MTNFKTVKGQVSLNSGSPRTQNTSESQDSVSKIRSSELNPVNELQVKDKGQTSKNFSDDLSTEGFSNELTSLPDLVIIVGQEKESKAIKECQKLNIPTITILDSDGDPEKTSLFIPANDDSRSSVEFILKHLGQSILIGRLVRFVAP